MYSQQESQQYDPCWYLDILLVFTKSYFNGYVYCDRKYHMFKLLWTLFHRVEISDPHNVVTIE